MGGSSKQKAALAAAPDAMKRPAALSAGQPPKFDDDHRAFHGNLPRLCTGTGQHIAPREMMTRPAREAQYDCPALKFSRTAKLIGLDLRSVGALSDNLDRSSEEAVEFSN